MSWYIVIPALILIVALACYKIKRRASYWKDRNIPYLSPRPKYKDTVALFTKKFSIIEAIKKLYFQFDGERYNGIYVGLTPNLQVRDPELIRKITIKDFDHFVDHTPIATNESDPLLAKNIIGLKGQKWRHMRATLSPSFTSSKMRFMFTLMDDCAKQFVRYFEKGQEGKDGAVETDMKDAFRRFTNDVIASSAFGITVDSLKDKENEFFVNGYEVTNVGFSSVIRQLLYLMMPKLMKILRIPMLPKRFYVFFQRVINETIELRERKNIVRPDMIHLLLETRKGKQQINEDVTVGQTSEGFAAVEEKVLDENVEMAPLTNDDIVAQAMIFFFAGFENAATVLAFLSLELAINPDLQRRLQEEIDHTLEKCEGKVTYEALLGMKYLDMVVSETLRKWPPAFAMERMCVKDYVIEPESPTETKLVLEKGVTVSIPVIGFHYDPKYFPEPDNFDPERFSDENKANIFPFTYLPFGSGPRNCIGSRFALLEIKILAFYLFSKFELVPSEKTEIPLVLTTKKFALEPEGGFWLGMKRRT